MCVIDEKGIVFETEVAQTEALQTLDLYKHTLGVTNLSSLQEMCVALERSGVSMCTRTHCLRSEHLICVSSLD